MNNQAKKVSAKHEACNLAAKEAVAFLEEHLGENFAKFKTMHATSAHAFYNVMGAT